VSKNKKIAAFSLLAHINDSNIGIKNFEDIFIPIVKSSICRMNNDGFDSGKSIMEIKVQVDKIYSLDIPIPILKKLLQTISEEFEIEGQKEFVLYKDGSFQMKPFLFADYEENLSEKETEIEEVDALYLEYLKSIKVDPATQPSIFDFIDQSRLNLSKYFAHKTDLLLEIEFVHQANFINSLKANKKVYEILRRVFLGSIISAYLEVEIGHTDNKVELLLDTNFIVGVLDLNSEESTHTCRKILEICQRIGYKLSILPFTVEEAEMLIERKAGQLENAFFQGYLDPESIYNAAKRRNLGKTQLEQIANNLRTILEDEYKIRIIANDTRYRNFAKYKYTDVYEFYKVLRGVNGFSAHHDATAISYVKEQRGGLPIKGTILKANCWFVTNTPFNIAMPDNKGALPEIIRADEILNYLWLSNPNVTHLIKSAELSHLGLTRLVSNTISYSLPSPSVLKSLDNNFNRYGAGNITADDTLMVASMIAKKKIAEPENLNKLAKSNPENFIQSVKVYAEQGREEEKELKEKLVKVLNSFEAIVNLKREEKIDKENTIILQEQNLESKISELKDDNYRLKQKFKNALIIGIIIILSIFLWTFDIFGSLHY